MENGKRKNLGYLGEEYQIRLISSFFTDPSFFKDLHSIIDQNMFSNTYLRAIVGIMHDYYEKYECVPSMAMMDIKIREKITRKNELEQYEGYLEKIKKCTSEGMEDIENMAEKFFIQQNWIRVANEILSIAGDGDMDKYEDCQRLISEALTARRQEYRYTNPYDDVERDLSMENIVIIPTGINSLDRILGGGLEKGKIGLIIATMGSGKTSLTTGLAAYAAAYRCSDNNNEGFRVMQIVFEDKNRDIHRKYFGRISQIETKELNATEQNTENALNLINNYPDKQAIKNNIRIYRLKSGAESVSGIERLIKVAINEGFKPDLVVLDYFECIKLDGNYSTKKHEMEERTMRSLETMAAELDIALWLPTQGNREGISADIVTTDKIQGSITKAQIAQVVMSISRGMEGMETNRANISILKNRSGGAGSVIPVTFNNGTCTITSDDSVNFGDFFGSQKDNDGGWTDVNANDSGNEKKKLLDKYKSKSKS